MGMRKKGIPVLLSAEEIADRVEAMAHEIASTLPQDVMIVCLLKGSFVFTADLIRELSMLDMRPQVDFLTLSSYGDSLESSGAVNVLRDLADEVAGRDVLIVDDILESGRTLHHAKALIAERGANSVRIAVLLEKPNKRDMAFTADFVGFTVPDRFVVGYGLDYANYYRELPYIGWIEIH